jgi:hypothetical protein
MEWVPEIAAGTLHERVLVAQTDKEQQADLVEAHF